MDRPTIDEHSVNQKPDGSHAEKASEKQPNRFFAAPAEMVTSTGHIHEPRTRLPELVRGAPHNNVPHQQQHHLGMNGSSFENAHVTYARTGSSVQNNMAQSGPYPPPSLGLATAPKQKTQAVASHRFKPGSRPKFLTDQPDYPYIMPSGLLLNFTMADILVILPGWTRNKSIISRFINNGLTAAVHIAIQQEHRSMDASEDIRRLRELTTDQYRRTMRQNDGTWRRARHEVPETWDERLLAVNNFKPYQAQDIKFTAPGPIAFAAMMRHIKKLPEGQDAGDLTRALEFAVKSLKSDIIGEAGEWMFPDDIHTILKHIGYTKIAHEHTDRAIFARYQRIVSMAAATFTDRKRGYEQVPAPVSKRRNTGAPKVSEHAVKPLRPGYPQQPSFWQGTYTNANMMPHAQPQVTNPHTTPERTVLAPILGRGGSQQHTSWPGAHANPNILPHLQPQAAHAAFSTYPAFHNHTLPTDPKQGSLSTPQAHELTRAGHFMQGPGVTLVAHSDNEDPLAPSEEPPVVPASLQADDDSPAPDMNVARPTNNDVPALPDSQFFPFDLEAASASPSLQRIDITGDDVPAMAPEEVDTMIAGHQRYSFSGLLTPSPESGLFPEIDMNVYNAITYDQHTPYPAAQLLRECVEADDMADMSDLARAARWCRDPANLSWEYVVGDLDFVMALQGMYVG